MNNEGASKCLTHNFISALIIVSVIEAHLLSILIMYESCHPLEIA